MALFDPAHLNHEDAHRWFGSGKKHGWATCPTTINGCVRVLSNPAYPTVEATVAEVVSRLRGLCADAHHQFWPEEISLLDHGIFRSEFIEGPRKITDACLLAMVVARRGRLVTFDLAIPIKAVIGASSGDVERLGQP